MMSINLSMIEYVTVTNAMACKETSLAGCDCSVILKLSGSRQAAEPPALGAGNRGFKSLLPDHIMSYLWMDAHRCDGYIHRKKLTLRGYPSALCSMCPPGKTKVDHIPGI